MLTLGLGYLFKIIMFADSKCMEEYVKCPDHTCIYHSNRCDGKYDRPNGQDEENCEGRLTSVLQTDPKPFPLILKCFVNKGP